MGKKLRCTHEMPSGKMCGDRIPRGLKFCLSHDPSICTHTNDDDLRDCSKTVFKKGAVICMNHQPKKKVEHQEPTISTRDNPQQAAYLPDGKKLPTKYVKRQPMPCPKCRAITIHNGVNRAVQFRTVMNGMAYFRCRVCDKRFSLPVKKTR